MQKIFLLLLMVCAGSAYAQPLTFGQPAQPAAPVPAVAPVEQPAAPVEKLTQLPTFQPPSLEDRIKAIPAFKDPLYVKQFYVAMRQYDDAIKKAQEKELNAAVGDKARAEVEQRFQSETMLRFSMDENEKLLDEQIQQDPVGMAVKMFQNIQMLDPQRVTDEQAREISDRIERQFIRQTGLTYDEYAAAQTAQAEENAKKTAVQ